MTRPPLESPENSEPASTDRSSSDAPAPPEPAQTGAENYARKTFKPGEYLFRQGEGGEAAYVIQKGNVELIVGLMREKTLAHRRKGDVIGEMALVDDRPHMASALATEETEVIAISKEAFDARLSAMDPAMRSIFEILVKRLREVSRESVNRKATRILRDKR